MSAPAWALRYSDHARDDLRDIIDYGLQQRFGDPLEFVHRLRERTGLLRAHPELGRVGRVNGTRELVLAGTPFIVVYRVNPNAQRVDVWRVLHGSQQWPPP